MRAKMLRAIASSKRGSGLAAPPGCPGGGTAAVEAAEC